jgi:hypothetical protein
LAEDDDANVKPDMAANSAPAAISDSNNLAVFIGLFS